LEITNTSQSSKSKVQSQFGASAHAYATSDVQARGDSLAVLVELARPESEWLVLDVGTGAGHTALVFAARVSRVLALDLTSQMLLETAGLSFRQDLQNVRPCNADAEYLPLVDCLFDLVTCRLAFHHFPNQAKAIGEMARVLKPGGLLGFTDNIVVPDPDAAEFYNTFERLRDPSHHRVQSLDGLKDMLEAANLQVAATRQLSKEFEFHAWADRQHVSERDKDRLLDMMRQAPPELDDLFSARWENGSLYFSLWEIVILARKAR
jgi:ubiquinone/menaquinone biosynthesis C-methylase UbiE